MFYLFIFAELHGRYMCQSFSEEQNRDTVVTFALESVLKCVCSLVVCLPPP